MRRVSALLLLAAIVVAGCGGTGEPAEQVTDATTTTASPTTEAAPSGLVVTVERSRLFEQRRSLAVSIENRTERTVTVVDPWLDTGRHEVADAEPRTVTLPPGRLLSFPVPYGKARCGRVEEVAVVHAVVDGTPAWFEAAVGPRIRAAHARECAGERARSAVELGFADDWAADGAVATGTLTVRPLEPDVQVVDVRTSIVFVTTAGTSLPTDRDLPLTVSAGRCDAHALIESKKTFTVAVHVRVGDDDPVPVEILVEDGPARSALDQAIEACVAATPRG